LFSGCITLPPSASLNPPSNRLGTVAANAWLNKVEIVDPEMDDQEIKAQVENTLTNNLLRFLRDGKYFRCIDLLPGKPQPDDLVLHVRFERYRQTRYTKVMHSSDVSDLSATLRIGRPDGQGNVEVQSEIIEKHSVAPFSVEAALPSGMKARTQLIEDLLHKGLSAYNPTR